MNENSIRKLADREGYVLHKSRAETETLDDHGEYMLIDPSNGGSVLGHKWDATLEEVESFLRAPD